jgi:Spy/CpxP family protein refolding chaperone
MKGLLALIIVYPLVSSAETTMSPYVKQTKNKIKALTKMDLDGLKKGHGTPFGGMAKAAELNGLPGPRHVLDLKNELKLTFEQADKIKSIYREMHNKAVKIGAKLVAKEAVLDTQLQSGGVNPKNLKKMVDESAKTYSELRYTHLVAHLKTKKVLSSKQVSQYNELRGYTSSDPCKNIPKGHPVGMWKKHNDCK